MQDVVDIRLRSWSVADSEDRAIGGEEGLEAVPPRGCRGRGPAGDLGAKPPQKLGY